MTNLIIKQLLLSNIVIQRKQIGSWNIMTTNLIEFKKNQDYYNIRLLIFKIWAKIYKYLN